ncbi:hypothetical protein MNBD_NITROSPINAE02-1532 [hydrothermal vent metagenome]|uniref:Glycosyltransferase 2-like domain-containing protein n=1 Tax=hydrothermal vent metagenome TaxID=652676 RepID=A0A3B1BQT4_9ZZZZ
MEKIGVYLLIRDDPYTLEELFGSLPRQSETRFEMIGIHKPGLSHPSTKIVKKKLKEIHVVEDENAGALLNSLVSSRNDDVIVVLDCAFIPSNQVWLSRLVSYLGQGDAEIVIGRIAHDIYTNWLIQNDFKTEQNLTYRDAISPFYFQFGNFAVTKEVIRRNPFPEGNFDEFALRWILSNPGKVRFVADAVVTYLDHITVDAFVEAYRNYSREAHGHGVPVGAGLNLFFRGIYRDARLSLNKNAPQWIFFSLYFRLRQAAGFLFAGRKG